MRGSVTFAWACFFGSIALLTFACLPKRLRAQGDGERLASVEGAPAELDPASAYWREIRARTLVESERWNSSAWGCFQLR